MLLYPAVVFLQLFNHPIAEMTVEQQSGVAFFSLTAFSAARSPPSPAAQKLKAFSRVREKHIHTHKRTENYNNNMMKGARRRLKVSSRKVLVPPVSKISRHAYQERSSHTQFRLTNCAAGKQEFKSLSREPPSYYQPSLLPLPPAPSLSLSLSHTHTFIHDFRGHTLAHINVRKTKTVVLTITSVL